jgi:nitrogenase iron protein NifH
MQGWRNGQKNYDRRLRPQSGSTRLNLGGLAQQTVLDTLRVEGDDIELNLVMKNGYSGIRCVESGGPEPGVGWRRSRIITSINLLERLGAYRMTGPTSSTTSSATVVCGGFAMPIREGKQGDLHRMLGRNDGDVRATTISKGITQICQYRRRPPGRPHLQLPQSRGEAELVCAFAKETGHADDPLCPRDKHGAAGGDQQENRHRIRTRPAISQRIQGARQKIDGNDMFVIPKP